ncbi:MAG TPA: hypothetical protein VI792_09555, partial [Candidatus Eisenbacteria bacterium]
MKKTLILTGVMLAVTCSMAWAAGLSMGWSTAVANDCPSSPASSVNRNSLCTANTGSNVIIGSVVAPGGLNDVVGESVIVDYQEKAATLSDWWNFGGCRSTPSSSAVLNMAFDPSLDDGICGDLWALNGTSAFSFTPNFPNPGFGRLTMVGAVATSLGGPWPAGTEQYSFRLSIDNRHTVAGTLPVCVGCLDGVLFAFNYAQINNAVGTGQDANIVSGDPNGHQCISWQNGGGTGGLVCPGIVPTQRATWGQVKSLYR